MTHDLLLFLAGVGAGIVGYLVGLASLISYPALIALGVPPIVANASNTVALVPGGVGSILTSWKRVREVKVYPLPVLALATVIGGCIGGALLLLAPAAVFQALVPWLVLLATVLIAFGDRMQRVSGSHRLPLWAFGAILTAVAIYGGYFGAGAGVMFLALCAVGTPMTTHESVLMKTPLLTLSNLVAAVIFILAGKVDWAAAIAVGLGSFTGGLVAPRIQQRIPERLMRAMVITGGVVLFLWLLLKG